MIGLYPCWSADEDNENYRYLSDLYAHWSVRELRNDRGVPRNYRGEHQPSIVRLFIGKNMSMVSSIRIDLRDPDMTFVIPLASFAYQGRVGKGEAWSTDLVSDDQTQPFFRIGPTTSAKINVTAKSSSELEVKAAGSVLGALRALTAVVSPGGALITTLNRESLQQTSNALDNALSSIWSESQDESQISGRQLSEWYPGSGFIIQLDVPRFFKTRGSEPNATNQPARRWYKLTLSCPRYSIFDTRQACDDTNDTKEDANAGQFSPHFREKVKYLRQRITAQQVNNFKLASGKTIQQFLSDQDWYSRFLRRGDDSPGNKPQAVVAAAVATPDAAAAAGAVHAAAGGAGTAISTDVAPKEYGTTGKEQRSENDYAALCNAIIDSLYSVGLSSLDARIGLWGIVTGSSDFVGIESLFQSNPRCPQLLPLGGGDTAWRFAVDDKPKKDEPTKVTTKGRKG